MERARQVAEGHSKAIWPRSSIVELNQLSTDLEHMDGAISGNSNFACSTPNWKTG